MSMVAGPDRTGDGPSPRSWLRVAMAVAVVAWAGNQFTPLLVMYRYSRGFSLVTVDLMLLAYVAGIVPALLVGGPLSDRFGRRALFLPAVPLSIVASALLAAGATGSGWLFAGRVVSGLGLGLAMAVGSSWIKELSSGPGSSVGPKTAARRASLSLTIGFAAGAGVAASLAQWAPWSSTLAYLVQIAIALPAAVVVLRAPETVELRRRASGRLRDDLRIPLRSHARFVRAVVPSAPWVFGAGAVAYAVLPGLVASRVASERIAFSGLATVVTLGVGALVQPFARRFDDPRRARALVVALVVTAAGMAVAALAAQRVSIGWVLVAAALLGAALGTNLVSGLTEVQRLAAPHELAGLTAVYYSLCYTGFAVPVLMALVSSRVSAPAFMLIGAALAIASATYVALAPAAQTSTGDRAAPPVIVGNATLETVGG